MLWVDEYRPRALDKLVVHRALGLHLQQLVNAGDCPHFLFYGASGAGKTTLVMALLRELFGPGVEKLKVENKQWKIERPDRKLEVELTTVSSNYHVEMNPSEAGFQDRYVVQEIIKEMAKSRPLDVTGQKGFKVVVLSEVDKLSKEAQHSLRRTMEKYSAACRLILVANNVSKVIEAVRSRCLNVRVPAASEEELCGLLQHVARKENLALPNGLAIKIAAASDRNMRRALLSLEATKAAAGMSALNEAMSLPELDWEAYVHQIATDMLAEQSPKQLYTIRQKLYELLANCIAPELIFRKLTLDLLRMLDAELKHEACVWAAYYEHRLQEGQKAILHLEAFVAKFMAVYKRFLINTFG